MKDFMNTFWLKKYFEWPSKWPGGNADVGRNIEKTKWEVAALDRKIGETTARKEAYQNKEQELGQKSQELSQSIANSEKKIGDHSAKIEDFGVQIDWKNKEIAMLEVDISSIEWSRAQTENSVAAMKQNIASILSSIKIMEWQEWKEDKIAYFRGKIAEFNRQVAHFSQEIAKMTSTIESLKVDLAARKSEKAELEEQKKNEENEKGAEIARKNDLIEQRNVTEFQKNLQHKNVVMSEDYIRDLVARQKAAVARQVAETNQKVEDNNKKQAEIKAEIEQEEKLDFDKIEQNANSIVDDLRNNPDGKNAQEIARRTYEYEKSWMPFEEAVKMSILDQARESSWSAASVKKVEDLKAESAKIDAESRDISDKTHDLKSGNQSGKIENPPIVENGGENPVQVMDDKNVDNSADIPPKRQDEGQGNKKNTTESQPQEQISQENSVNNWAEWAASGVVDVSLNTGNSTDLPLENNITPNNPDENPAEKSEEKVDGVDIKKWWENETVVVVEDLDWKKNQWDWLEIPVVDAESPIELPPLEVAPVASIPNPVGEKARPAPEIKIDAQASGNVRARVSGKPQAKPSQAPERIATKPVSRHENLRKITDIRKGLVDILRQAQFSESGFKGVLSPDALSAYEAFMKKPSPETFRKFETETVKQILIGNFANISANKESPEWQEFKNLYLVNPQEVGQENKDFTIKDLEMSLAQKEYLSFSELSPNFAKGKQDALGIFLYGSSVIGSLQALSKNVNNLHAQDLADKEKWTFEENRYDNGTRVTEEVSQSQNTKTQITRTTMTVEEANNLEEVKKSYATNDDFKEKFKEYSPRIADIANEINRKGGFKKSEFQEAYKAHFLNMQASSRELVSANNSAPIQFSRANVFVGQIASAEQARHILSDGGSIPLRKPDNTQNSVEVLIFYKDPRVERLSMSINGNEITPPENLEAMDRFRYMKFLSDNADHPLLGRILKSPYGEWLKYFEKKFAEKYPNEKLGQYPHHFFEVVANEIAEKAGISELKVQWEEWVRRLMKRFEDTNFVRDINKKMTEARVIDSSGEINRRTLFLANEKNTRPEERQVAEKKLEDEWPIV